MLVGTPPPAGRGNFAASQPPTGPQRYGRWKLAGETRDGSVDSNRGKATRLGVAHWLSPDLYVGCQSRLVVNRVVPWTGSTSFRSVSVNPTFASTRREAVFHSQTVAHRRSHPDDLAQSTTANEASVAYP